MASQQPAGEALVGIAQAGASSYWQQASQSSAVLLGAFCSSIDKLSMVLDHGPVFLVHL